LDLIAIGWAIVKNRHHNEAHFVKLSLEHCLKVYQFTLFSPSCAGPYFRPPYDPIPYASPSRTKDKRTLNICSLMSVL
jgi:hypothetical protein